MKYISIVKSYEGDKRFLRVGHIVRLIKDHENLYDDEAIVVKYYHNDNILENIKDDYSIKEIDEIDIIDKYTSVTEHITIGYVANSVKTVARGTCSGGRIYDTFEENIKAKVKFITKDTIIVKIIEK